MDLEVVFQELGQFGRYQVFQFALLTVPFIASAFEELGYIFTSSQVQYRCLVPECELANTTEFNPVWLQSAVPYVSGDLAWCHRYSVNNREATDCRSADSFLHNETISCDHWVFATHESTAAVEFQLLCENKVWLRTLVGTVNNIGLITNYVLICYLSDRFGRKKVLFILSFAQGLLAMLQSLSSTFLSFLIFEYFICFCSTYNSAFILGLEVVGGDKRMFANCLMNSLYSVGEVVVALLMWWIQDFRLLLRVFGVVKLTNVLYLWLVSESVHWYLIKERYDEVIHIIKRIAQFNCKELSAAMQHHLSLLQLTREKTIEMEQKVPTKSVIKELLKSPPLLKRFAICSFTWLMNLFVYFGFSLMSVTLAGNKYINFMLIALVEIPAYVSMWIGMEYCNLGRKTALELASFVAAVPCLIYLFVPDDAAVTQLCLFLFGKFSITVSYTVVYEISAELFPTELRQSMVGLCCAVACIGGLIAPQIPLLALYVEPMMMFFCFSIGAGCLSLMLPETQGQALPSTITQALKLNS